MKLVILAGGLGTRISEETHLRPKPMIEIGGRPIIWHIMKMYSDHGISDLVICCGYIDDATNIDKLLLVATVAGEARDFPRCDGTDLAEAVLGHHPVETGTRHSACCGSSEIVINGVDVRPAQRHEAIAHGVLQGAALPVVQDLVGRRLPYITGRTSRIALRSRCWGPIFSKIIAHLLAGEGGIARGVIDQQHQRLAHRYRQSPPPRHLVDLGIARAGKQIELKGHGLARHGGLNASRESQMRRPKSAEPKWGALPAAALPSQPERQYRRGEPPRNAPPRKFRDRTSMSGAQDSAPTSNRRYCSAKCSRPPARRSHECERDGRPKDATDIESREHRSHGRSVAALYTHRRLHSTLCYTSPMGFEHQWLTG